MPVSRSERFHTIAVVVALAAVAGIVAFVVLRPSVVAGRPPGVVQPTEIKIAPEISGRLSRFGVAPGQTVHKGDTLVELSNPELEAGLVLAQAQAGQARAARDRVYAGPRQEQVDALAREIDMANANLAYAQQQFSRTSQLAATGFASHQDLDKATAAVETGSANLSRAKERYEAARLGPTSEQRAVADANVAVAEAAVAVIAARVAKLQVRAPLGGAVALVVAEPGEAIVPGQPVMTLQPRGQRWASFNMREDQLDDLQIGSRIELTPANSSERIQAHIVEIIPHGEFAYVARCPRGRRLRPEYICAERRPGRSFRSAAAGDVGLAKVSQQYRAGAASGMIKEKRLAFQSHIERLASQPLREWLPGGRVVCPAGNTAALFQHIEIVSCSPIAT